MKYLFSFILLYILFTGFKKEDSLLVSLLENAVKYNEFFPSEHVYVITDRTFYKPGDELWFRAIAKNSLDDKELSNDLNIKLLDVFGKQILNIRYPLIENESKGYLILPAYITEGKYRLIAYTGWMKNLPLSSAFCKEIIISNHINRQFDLTVTFAEKLYYPGRKIEGNVKLLLPDGSPLYPAKFSYRCRSVKRSLIRGWGTTDENGNGNISFDLPADTDTDRLWLEFTVKRKKKSEIFVEELPVARKNIDIQFFPEGGKLIAGLENRIAFKAIDNYGFPVEIDGYLLDESGRQIGRIKSSYLGLGIFNLKPGKGKYYLRLIRPVTDNFLFDLPDTHTTGIQLNYLGIKDGEMIFSLRNSVGNNKEKLHFLAEQNGKIVWVETINLVSYELVKIHVGKFSEGLVKFTLLDDSGNVAAVRAVISQLQESEDIPDVMVSKDTYRKREKVHIELKNHLPEKLSASLAVSKSTHICHSEISLQQYLNCFIWLRDALLKYFENPLSDENADLILLTHVVKSLPITGLCTNDYKYSLPYFNQDGITGQIFDKKSNPQENARVKIIHTPDLRSFQASSDAKGIFNIKFDNRIINYDLLSVAIADESGKSSSNYTIYDHYTDNILKTSAREKSEWESGQIRDLMKYKNPLLLYSGKFRHGKDRERKEFSGKGYNYKKYSLYLRTADIVSELKSYKVVNDEIVFIGHENSINQQHGALIVIDGIAIGTSADILNSISPKDIRNISVSTSTVDIQRYTALNSMGIIEISTMRGDENSGDATLREIQKDILMLDHEFSGPDYAVDERDDNDNRVTLFWKPDISVGNAVPERIMFYTSDIEGNYFCTITGIDSNGKLFSKQVSFKVK